MWRSHAAGFLPGKSSYLVLQHIEVIECPYLTLEEFQHKKEAVDGIFSCNLNRHWIPRVAIKLQAGGMWESR